MALSRLTVWSAGQVLRADALNAEFDNLINQVNTAPTSYTIGDLLQANTGTTLASLAAVATGNALISGGVGVISSWGKIALTTHVSGILPTANGGTGIAFFTAAGPTVARIYTFPDAAATVLTSNAAVTVAQGGTGVATLGDAGVLIGNATGVVQVTSAGTSGQVLTSNGAGVDPTFQAAAGGSTITSGTATVATAETTTSTTYADLATTGPTVTITPGASGNLLIMVTAKCETTVVNGRVYADFALSSGNTRSAADATAVINHGEVAGEFNRNTATTLLTGLTLSSTVVKMQYRIDGGMTGRFSDRHLIVMTW